MPQVVVKSIVFVVVGFLFGTCPITFLTNQDSVRTSEHALRQVMEGSSCTGACWQSIQPGQTTIQDVDEMLHTSGVTPYVVWRLEDQSPMTYEWEYAGPELPSAELDRLRNAMVVFSETGTVLRVVVLVDLCLATVIDEYGLPNKAVRDVFEEIQLLYPKDSLLFTVNNSRVSAIARVAQSEFPEGDEIPLEQLVGMLDPSCSDAFSR